MAFLLQQRKSLRLKGFDYSTNGAYYITICTKNRECCFGNINDGVMLLNDFGEITYLFLDTIPNHFDGVELDEFVIMPNHIHVIVVIDSTVGDNDRCPLLPKHPYTNPFTYVTL